MPALSAHIQGNPGAEWYPIPASVGSFRLCPAARQLHPLLRNTHPLRPSRLLTWTGAPQRLKGGVCGVDQPWRDGACVGYISISRGTVQRGPSFHPITTSPPPLTGMKAAIPSHLLVCMNPGVPSPHPPLRCLFIFSCSHCPPMNAVNRTLLSEFLSENEERGNNARLNKHFGN